MHTTRRFLMTALSIFSLVGTVFSQQTRLPNIIFIMADDLGYGDIGLFGATDIRTPHIDAIGKQGIALTACYTPSPVCSPTRASLLTGRYPRRMGIDGVFFPDSYTGMPPSEVTMAEVLKTRGYRTGIVGKWHLGHHLPFLPLQQGFEEYYGIPYSNDMQAPVYLHNNEVDSLEIDQRYTTQTYTRKAVDFIRRHRDSPFFLYIPHSMPHVPIYASEPFVGRSKRGLYGDVVEELDHSVGEIMATLRELGLEENTLVVFTSDNGPWLAYREQAGSAGPLREGKQTTFDGGMRVPTVAQWPGQIPEGIQYEGLVTFFDFMPTFAAMAGAEEALAGITLDGENILPVLQGTGKRQGDELLYYYNRELQAIRKGDWKLKMPFGGVRQGMGQKAVEPHELFLFNLATDLGETRNVASEHPEKANELKALLLQRKAEMEKDSQPYLRMRIPADQSHQDIFRKNHMAETPTVQPQKRKKSPKPSPAP